MLPDKIVIGCYEYRVVETDEVLVLNGRECGGTIDYRNQVIEISTNMALQAKEQTFWHEVVHGLVHYRNVDLKNADEETIVEEIATGLYGLMKSNGLLPGQTKGNEQANDYTCENGYHFFQPNRDRPKCMRCGAYIDEIPGKGDETKKPSHRIELIREAVDKLTKQYEGRAKPIETECYYLLRNIAKYIVEQADDQ